LLITKIIFLNASATEMQSVT